MTESGKQRLLTFLKGMAMGMADAVPGVSGGTIAVMTHIYERLVAAIRSITPAAFLLWRSDGFTAFWQRIDGAFLLTLGAGILSALILMANIVLYLLAEHAILLLSFFIGLVLASAWFLRLQVRRWGAVCLLALLGGILVTALIAMANPLVAPDAYWYLFLCGVVAISAMILPGLSGAFILLLLGVYENVLEALRGAQLDVIIVFATGCAIGLLGFAHFLTWLFHRFREQTYAFLTGMLLASVIVLWPWKAATPESSEFVSSGRLWPGDFAAQTGLDPQLLPAALCLFAGLGAVFVFEKLAGREIR